MQLLLVREEKEERERGEIFGETKGASYCINQVGVAVWLECWLSHLG